MYELLDKIESPADIKGLTTGQLRTLCAELRQYIIETCATNPGHLAASLGAVELIVGVHYVYDTPADQLVFDVGHQAYAHKVLTGRREAFRTMRTKDGISGFPNRSESPYDAFGVGHSSTSVSAALGLAEAARMQGRHDLFRCGKLHVYNHSRIIIILKVQERPLSDKLEMQFLRCWLKLYFNKS